MKTIRISHLTYGKYKTGGRSFGRITAPRRGSKIKRKYRFLDTKRSMFPGMYAFIVTKGIYDPNRSGRIALILYPNGVLAYI